MTDVSRAVWRLVLRVAIAAMILLVIWFLGGWIWRLFSPFLLAIPVAVMLQRPIRWCERRLRFKHGLAVAVWVVLVCLAICALLYWLASTLIGQVLQLGGNAQAMITDVINTLRNVANQLLDALDYLPVSAQEWARGAMNDAFAELSVTATRWMSAVFNFAINLASGIPYGLVYLNFLLLGIFFITSEYSRVKQRLLGSMGDDMRSRSQMLSGSAGHGLIGYVKVQLLYGVIVLAVSIPALSLFGLPYAPFIAFLAAILEFMPIFGNGTLYIPWAIICYIIGMPTLGTEMLILHMALYVGRKATEPKLLSNQMGISTLLSLIAMFVGMQVGGVLGLILAPVAVVVVQGAWVGGLFTSTVADIRRVIGHIRARLSEPEA